LCLDLAGDAVLLLRVNHLKAPLTASGAISWPAVTRLRVLKSRCTEGLMSSLTTSDRFCQGGRALFDARQSSARAKRRFVICTTMPEPPLLALRRPG